MKKKTRAQKILMNKSSGQSRYAKKIEWRRKMAARMGSDDMPLPILKLEVPQIEVNDLRGEDVE